MKTGTLLTVHENTTPVLVLSHMNPFQVIPFYFSKIHFNNIIQYMPRSCSKLFPFRLSHRYSAHISPVSLVCYMPRPSHPPWSRQLYDLGKQESSRKFSSFISPHSTVFLLPLWSRHCSPSSVLKSPKTTLFPWWKRLSSTPIQNNIKKNFTLSEPYIVIYIYLYIYLYILIYILLPSYYI